MPLRLKSLELQGYKTFASRTAFEFASGITAIVGPNGSGKSNIADALRWVLGEQSYSLLRGKKTEDMIFSGSEHRPRAGMASVHVVFDNSNGWLPIDFAEVGMTRRAYRDGHNEYLLNNQQVRLRDLNELLAASGLAERTYTIIGQGLVDASLALKADERRRLFEEAAGVGLYRLRREDTLKRLENTTRNLERVLDILSELEPRLRSLERQAKRALDYARAQSELKVILRDWYGYHWHRARQELAGAREAVQDQERRLHEERQVHAVAQSEYNNFRGKLTGLRAQLNIWQRQSAELHSQREEVRRELAVLEERQRSLLLAQSSALSDRDRTSDEERIAQERLAEAEQEALRLQVEHKEAQKEYAEARQALLTKEGERASVEEQLRLARTEVEKWNAQRAESQARLDELESRLDHLRSRIDRVEQALGAAAETARLAGEKYMQARAAREAAESRLKKAESEIAELRRQVERLEEAQREKSEERARALTEHSRLQAQLEVLEQAEQSLAGYAEGARFLLDAARQSRLRGARGALSEALDVPAELEAAIAAALGDTLDAILLDADEIETALQLLESDSAGRAALLPLENHVRPPVIHPSDQEVLGVASELIHAPEELRTAVDRVLGQTLIVRDRAAARRLLKHFSPHVRMVTLGGEVFRGDGLIIAGRSAASTALSRPRQKRELTGSLEVLSERVDALDRELETFSAHLTNLQHELYQAGQTVYEARLRLDETQRNEQQAQLESESARRQLEWQQSQQAQLHAEADEAASMRQDLIQSQAEAERQSGEAQQAARALSDRLNAMDLAEAQAQVSYWNTRIAVADRALADALSRKEEREKEAQKYDMRHFELTTRLQEAETSLSDLERDQSSLRERERVLVSEIEALRRQIDPAEKELEAAEQEEARLQEAEASTQRALASAERYSGQLQLDEVRKQEALDTLREKLIDDFSLVMLDNTVDVLGPASLPADEILAELPVVTELSPDLEAQLTQSRTRVRRMGLINPEAKQEFETESERYKFLNGQVDDLRRAEEDLKKLIAELDDLTEQQFSKTFEAVDKQFRAMFTRLFGGGSARLTLTEPENLVETGIEIEARLPGRREQGLALLSGGERSLTAVALVFALLKVSPTPVCVLDEVDAMLDEANVGRFRDLLLELSQDTQFIIITHNRNTVQVADVIYGITMGRDSTSQVISLRLDQVTEEMLKVG